MLQCLTRAENYNKSLCKKNPPTSTGNDFSVKKGATLEFIRTRFPKISQSAPTNEAFLPY